MPQFAFNTRALTALLFAVLALLIASCGGASVPSAQSENPTAIPTNAAPAATVALPANAAGVTLVARVNGTEITLPEFERAFARREQEVAAADLAALQASVLDTLIEQALIEQGAASQGIAVSDEALETDVQSYRTQAGSDEVWQQWLADNLYTEEEFRRELRAALVTGLMRDSLTANLAGEVTQVHARHILVSTEAEANALLTRLAAGEDFGVLAALSNDVTTRDSGGDLGWFTQEELLEPVLASVAFSLEPGQSAGPIATRLGYHIIQTLEREARSIEPDKQAALAQAQFESWVQSLYTGAQIERYL